METLGIQALAERFTLTPAEIRTLAPKAAEGRETLWTACRSLSQGRLGRLATMLPCPFGWEDIVLPKDTKDHLKEIAAQTAHRTKVYDEWGFGRQRPLGRGITALFAGPSGTGKTMAAQVLAAEMGVVLYRIDLASVVSKYVGETEKNLRRIFDEAERLNAVLFFDEADALFGKRTQVKDAHDRYANIEVNYLLQRMESYEGLAILATNRKGDIDSAFLRRLRFIVEFSMPGVKERSVIWRLALPEQALDGAPLLNEIDWELLARKLEITGAAIKDIALESAFLACGKGKKIGMRHISIAINREMVKHGRVMDIR
jgi:SpoVK/Ycf46/Vps4 family AAA+-type ATPase